MAAQPDLHVLADDVWQARQSAHEARVNGWIQPILERGQRGQRHPVDDFLFTYYSYRPARLRRWSPGAGVVLAGVAARHLLGQRHWVAATDGVTLAPVPPRVGQSAGWIAELLAKTAKRTPRFGCFGLHEWAMVHRQQPDEVRHAQFPLRLGPMGTTAVVDSLPIRCSHFDAFRFFAPSARSLNTLQPTRDSQHKLEQGGCLHANMDLYKWAYKLAPWVPAELVADCFDLARRVRVLDMRASPYDLTSLGYDPIPIETPEGRKEYVEGQRRFAAQASALRGLLVAAATQVATVAS